MSRHRDNNSTVLVSFSGIDGAGKTTQIEALSSRLIQDGVRVRVIRFWDEVARLKRVRETSGHTMFKGDKGVGSQGAPINRRDKNVQSPVMTAVRLILYFLDAISLRRMVKKVRGSAAEFVIFDRYIYDELANLRLSNPFALAYARAVIKLVPRPDVIFLLDAEPVAARARKPEYPLDFIHLNRRSYLCLSKLVADMTVIPPLSIQHVEQEIMNRALRVASL